jgi:hypothetical protein
VLGSEFLSKVVHGFCLAGLVFGDLGPKGNHQFIGFATEDKYVNVAHELRVMFMYFVVAA